jgi:hypothetical protein
VALANRIVAILESRNDWVGNFSVVISHAVRQRPLPASN